MRTIEVTMADNTLEKFYPKGINGRVDYNVFPHGVLGISDDDGDSCFCTYARGTWKKVKVVDSQ